MAFIPHSGKPHKSPIVTLPFPPQTKSEPEEPCQHKVCKEDPEPYCVKCGDVLPVLMVHPYEEHQLTRYHHSYSEKGYFDEKMNLLMGVKYQGKLFYMSSEETQLFIKQVITKAFEKEPNMTWPTLWRIWSASIPKTCKPDTVQYLNKFSGCFIGGRNIDFLCIPWIMDRIPPVTPMIYHYTFYFLYQSVFVRAEKVKLGQFYLLYKLMEIFRLDYTWIPLKKSPATIRKYDKSWARVCRVYGLPFLPSNTPWKVTL